MPGKWDRSSKQLIGENPSHFIQWLLPDAQYQGVPKPKTPTMETKEIEADSLFQILLVGVLCLVHIEFQSSPDEEMARRMWQYNALATITYDLPTSSIVVFLRPCRVPEPFYTAGFPTGERVHHFWFKVIKLWEITVNEFKQTGLTGIFPLMVLAKDGKRPEVIEEIIQQIEADSNPSAHELLAVTYTLASLVFKKAADRSWLKRRFSVLDNHLFRDSWVYQELIQEGLEKGRQEGVEKGLQEGIEKERQQRLKDQRQMLMTLVQAHFPQLATMAQRKANAIKKPDVLQTLVLNMVAAQTEEQARQLLQTSKTQKQKP